MSLRKLGTGIAGGRGSKPGIADDAVERDGDVSGGTGPGCTRPHEERGVEDEPGVARDDVLH